MTSKKNLFSSIQPSLTHQSVYLANGSTSVVTGCGDISLSSSLFLSSILLVPKFSISLLSVSQLTKSIGCSMTFFLDSCVFQDLKMKRMIGGGREKGFYYFDDFRSSPPQSIAAASASIHDVSTLQWHAHLRHPSLCILHQMIPSLSSESVLECEAYQLGKHTHQSYPLIINKTSEYKLYNQIELKEKELASVISKILTSVISTSQKS